MGQLDASIINLAYRDLQASFHASLGSVEWVALAYLLVLVGLVVAIGRFADMVGRKLLYTYGFVLFTLASVGCGLAPSLGVLVALRAVQAVGAAMLQANSVALITVAMPAGMLGRGLGVQGAAQALGLALGPTVGGALVALGGWRLIFFVNVPAGIIGTALAWLLLPRTRQFAPKRPIDALGLGLFFLAAGTLLAGLSLATTQTRAVIVTCLVVSAAAWSALVLHTRQFARQGRSPLIPPALFASKPFSAGIVAGLLSYLVLFGILFIVPFLLEQADGLSAARTGLALTVLPVAIGVLAPVAGQFADRHGARAPTSVGMAVLAGGLVLTATTAPALWGVVAGLAVAGVGLGAFTPANNSAIMHAVRREQAGLAGGVLNMTRGVGTATGVAVTGLVYDLRTGGGTSAAVVTGGFQAAAVLLAVLAGAAACVSLLGSGRPRRGGSDRGDDPVATGTR